MERYNNSATIIALVVSNQQTADYISSTFADEISGGSLIVQIIGPQDINSGYRRLKAMQVDAIMARGGTYQEFMAINGDIPLLEMKISMLDILDTLKGIEESGEFKEVYLLLNDTIRFNQELCSRFINIPVTYLPFSDYTTLLEMISSVPPDSLIVGSGFASELSKGHDLNFMDMLIKPETLRTYYNQAKELISQIRKEKDLLTQLQATLAQIQEGVIVIDTDGIICNINKNGKLIAGLNDNTVIGRRIQDVLPAFPFSDLLGKAVLTPQDKLITVGKVDLNLSIVSYIAYQSTRYYLLTMRTVKEIQRLERNVRYKLAEKGLVAQYSFKDIITQDEKMLQAIENAKRIANDDSPILIRGESGTGKELFAQSMHMASNRKNGPFVAVNCAALSESLLESELFGYVSGAFTGARKEGKVGLFELAHKGTIFLDEINSMSPGLQAKLLRVIEEKQIMRIGSDYVIPLDIRIMSASNQSLRECVREGNFRLDLYYRLNTFVLQIPPLRERKSDIESLFKYYVAQKKHCSSDEIILDEQFLDLLLSYEWPGNVRELKSTALRYVVFNGDNSSGNIIPKSKIHNDISSALTDPNGHINLGELSRTVEDLVLQSLLNNGMSKSDVAKTLGISRQALYKRLNRTKDDNI